MAYSGRPQSPGSRRIQNPARASDSRVSDATADQYRESRHNSTTSSSNNYTSPRSSGGVIPISTETFVNYPPTQASRIEPQRYDSYSNAYSSSRSRGPSVSEAQRTSTSNTTQSSARTRPTVVQNSETARPTSPLKGTQARDYYVTPSTTASKEPRKEAHKRVYTVNDGTANLVADVNVPKEGDRERHHRRRDSSGGERGGYIRPPSERDRARRGYHLNGPTRRVEKSIDDDDAYSYTTPAAMYVETEPKWREPERRRRNSIERGNSSRERPAIDPSFDSRRLSRDIGPPPSTRGWDKVNDMTRSTSTREPRVAQSPTRSKVPMSPGDPRMTSPPRGRYADGSTGDPRDPYYVAPRRVAAVDRRYDSQERAPVERYEIPDYREPRRHERRHSMTRVPDRSVERRGFGIRSDSKDRYGRESDENFHQQNNQQSNQQNIYRDSGYAVGEPPHRRDTAPEFTPHDEQRFEQEKRDRQAAREARDRDSRRYEEEPRGHERDHESDRNKRRERDAEYDVDRERERARERMMQPQPPAESDRSHYREDGYRDRDYDRSPRDMSENIAQPRLSTAAAGGLAAAAAAYGVSNHQNSRNDDRDRDRDRERNRDREQHERTSPRPPDRAPQGNRGTDSHHSDEGVQYRQDPERHRSDDNERGLGFAFEAPPEPPKSAPPVRDRPNTTSSRDTAADREFERSHEDEPPDDPDEDYRRRKEQIQRELGLGPEDRASDSDPDRERRRREREQRLRDREPRNGESSTVVSNSTYTDPPSTYQMPGAFDNDSVDDSANADGRPSLRRRRSILDEPMTGEPAQIIDNSLSEKRENRVRIVDPPTEEEEKKPKGILKKPKDRFPEHPNEVREGVAPLGGAATGEGIPVGARWTRIDRRLVNPEALEQAKERFEERLDCVIVLRVLTKEEIQKLANRTQTIRDARYQEEREERRAARRRERERDRLYRDEYEDDSENEFKPRAPRLLEAPQSSAGASGSSSAPLTGGDAEYAKEYAKERDRDRDRRRDRERERESDYY